MNRFSTSLILFAITLLGAPLAQAQVGPLPPDEQPALEAGQPTPDEFVRPTASITESEQAPVPDRASLADESSIPLGAPDVSKLLPRLDESDEQSAQQRQASAPTTERPSRFTDVVKTVGALLFVIALILALAWGVRRIARTQGGIGAKLGAGGRAPSGVLEVLGRYPVGGKLSLVVLRFDRRVLLLAQNHASGGSMSTLCELTDADDIASVLSKTTDTTKLNSAFQEAIAHAERDVQTALAPETHVPIHAFDPGARRVTATEDGDRLELLRDSLADVSRPEPELSPLRRRLDALRAGGAA